MRQAFPKFWSRVDYSGPRARPGLTRCWLWTGPRTIPARGAYGVINIRGKFFGAHRVAFALVHGRVPVVARHTCDVTHCVRPSHILDGTHADNVRDKTERDRVPHGSRHHASKLTEAQVLAIRSARASGTTVRALAALNGVSEGAISMVCSGRRWRRSKVIA